MPRGDETQEGEQTSRDVKAQNEVKEQESRRDQEVLEEPAAVIERERPIEQSEKIEKEVIEALEAADRNIAQSGDKISATPITLPKEDGGPETEDREEAAEAAADGGRRTEDGGEVAVRSSEEISATPITLPKEDPNGIMPSVDEISATPITLPKEDPDGIKTSMEEISATPITLPKEDPEGSGEILREDQWSGRDVAGVENNPNPMPSPTDVIEVSSITMPSPADPAGEIGINPLPLPSPSDDIEINPVPMPAPTDDIEVNPVPMPTPTSSGGEAKNDPIPMPSPTTTEGEIENNPLPLPGPTAEGEETGAEEEGGSILIGTEGEEELQKIDLTTEAAKEVEEYWEPPDIYIYTAEDGSISFVDAQGNPINCPPSYYIDKGGSGAVKAWYPGGNKTQAFDVPPFPGYKADEFYVKAGPEDSYILVDREGNPVPNQWKWTELYGDPKNGFSYSGPDGPIFGIKMFSEFYIYTAQDGTKTFVDSSGNPLKCPPKISGDHDGGYFIKGPNGEKFEVKDYSPPTTDIYLYTAQDGTKIFVDSSGNLIQFPPTLSGDHDGGYFIKGSEGEKIEVQDYSPPSTDIYVYTAADGTKTVVDEKGDPVNCPPKLSGDPEGGYFIKGPEGEKFEVKDYTPQTADIYVYTAQNGIRTLVDIAGNPIKCPPYWFYEAEVLGAYLKGADGKPIGIPAFTPKMDDIFMYSSPDGTLMIVDSDGKTVESPPFIKKVVGGDGVLHIYASYQGQNAEDPLIELKYYKPPSAHWKK